jgi:hypothetical protein
MQLLLDAHGDTAPTPEAVEARDEALALLAELRAARHGLPAPRTDGAQGTPGNAESSPARRR